MDSGGGGLSYAKFFEKSSNPPPLSSDPGSASVVWVMFFLVNFTRCLHLIALVCVLFRMTSWCPSRLARIVWLVHPQACETFREPSWLARSCWLVCRKTFTNKSYANSPRVLIMRRNSLFLAVSVRHTIMRSTSWSVKIRRCTKLAINSPSIRRYFNKFTLHCLSLISYSSMV